MKQNGSVHCETSTADYMNPRLTFAELASMVEVRGTFAKDHSSEHLSRGIDWEAGGEGDMKEAVHARQRVPQQCGLCEHHRRDEPSANSR